MSVTKKDGIWYIVLSQKSIDKNGAIHYKQPWIPTDATTEKEAKEKESDFKKQQKTGHVVDHKRTVKQLYDLWIELHVCSPAAPLARKTKEWYQDNFENHINPVIGHIKTYTLQVLDLDEVLSQCAKKGGTDTTLRGVYATMRAMFGWAKKKRLVDENLMLNVDRPFVAERERVTLKTVEDLSKFFQAIKVKPHKFARNSYDGLRETYFTMFLLDLTTGLRADELCGLRVSDINFDEKYVKIEQQVLKSGRNPEFGPVKNRKGKNSQKNKMIALSDMVIEELKEELTRNKERKENCLSNGGEWREYGLIFVNQNGGPIDSKNLNTRVFKKILVNAGLPEMKLHELRHSVGTILGESNEDPNAICDMLRQHDPSFTKKTYIHSGVKSQRAASQKLESIMKTAIKNKI